MGHFSKMKQGEQRRVGSFENSEEKMYLYEGALEKEEEREKLEVIVRRPAEKCYCKPHWEQAEEEEDKSILNTATPCLSHASALRILFNDRF